MRIHALLSFFDEPPELLAECITRLRAVGIDRLIAIDGAYDLYPSEDKTSSFACFNTLLDETLRHGIDIVLRNKAGWSGNEVEKRTYMLEVALEDTKPEDWLLVVDADHFWESDVDLHELLANAGAFDFARVSFAEVFHPNGNPLWAPARPLMRARSDLRMGSNHYTYELDYEGKGFSTFLERPEPSVPAFDLMDLVHVVHKVYERHPAQRARQISYYHRRDTEGIET